MLNLNSPLCLHRLERKRLLGFLEKTSGTIEEQLAAIALALEQLWKKKDERIKEISDVQAQIRKICGEIVVSSARNQAVNVDMSDLSLKKLDEFHYQLQELQKEKVMLTYAITNMGLALLAIDLEFMGPNYLISTAFTT
ncbi:putative microtubule-associated protein, MAP65/Ase1/PRC1 [Helianthus annuus]|nr:putative microtubule-associated protein, MAP65/Ase1/PRC1 [Helianthus annuus]KAJ0856464.1 putative microtubule-associated protein, MAP65/Ase1/PRC1 [Helianthus annuus]